MAPRLLCLPDSSFAPGAFLLSPWAVNMWLFVVFPYICSMSVFLSEACSELGTPDLQSGILVAFWLLVVLTFHA